MRSRKPETSRKLVLRKIMEELGPEVSFREGLVRRFSPGKDLLEEADLLRRVLETFGEGKGKSFFGKSSGEIFVWIVSGKRKAFFYGWEYEDFTEAEIVRKRREMTGCETREETFLWLESRGK